MWPNWELEYEENDKSHCHICFFVHVEQPELYLLYKKCFKNANWFFCNDLLQTSEEDLFLPAHNLHSVKEICLRDLLKRQSTAPLRWRGPHSLTHFLTVTQSCLSWWWRSQSNHFSDECNSQASHEAAHSSPLLSRFDKCIGEEDTHLGAYVLFFHNVKRETSKLCLLHSLVHSRTRCSLGLFELQRDCSLLLLHGHSVWIVISCRPLFSLLAFTLSLIASHSVAFLG